MEPNTHLNQPQKAPIPELPEVWYPYKSGIRTSFSTTTNSKVWQALGELYQMIEMLQETSTLEDYWGDFFEEEGGATLEENGEYWNYEWKIRTSPRTETRVAYTQVWKENNDGVSLSFSHSLITVKEWYRKEAWMTDQVPGKRRKKKVSQKGIYIA